MDDILYFNAHLLGIWLQLFAFGVYLVYLQRCARILLDKRREGRISLWLPAVCLLMFVITSTLLVENLVAGYRAWHVPSDAGLPNPAVVYSAVASTTSLVRNSAIVALAIVSDFIMVYRTFIVWASNYTIILVPVGLLLADIAFAVWSTWTLSQTGAGDDAITALVAVRVRYFFFVTFAVNLLCAALICWKIWRVHSNLPAELSSMRRSKSSTVRVFEVIVETAAIYCAHLLVLIISDSIGSNTFFVFLDPLPPVTALVFTVLIVRTRTPQVRPATSIMSAIQFVSQPEQSFVSNGT